MARVYVETSFFSACVSSRTDLRSLSVQRESRGWWVLQRRLHELIISSEVVRELSDESFENRHEALALTLDCGRVDITAEARGFAKILVSEKAMPGPVQTGDAVHVAAAIVHRCEYLLTWNVRHLANPNKRMHLARVCMKFGLIPCEIVTPDSLWTLSEET